MKRDYNWFRDDSNDSLYVEFHKANGTYQVDKGTFIYYHDDVTNHLVGIEIKNLSVFDFRTLRDKLNQMEYLHTVESIVVSKRKRFNKKTLLA